MSVAIGEGRGVTVSATGSATVGESCAATGVASAVSVVSGEGCAATGVASAVGVVSGEGCAATGVASAVGVVSGEGCAATGVTSMAGVSVRGRVGSGSTVGSAPPIPGSGNPAHPASARRSTEIQIMGRVFRIDLVLRSENCEPRTRNQEPRTENREPGTENRESKTFNLQPSTFARSTFPRSTFNLQPSHPSPLTSHPNTIPQIDTTDVPSSSAGHCA